MIAEVGHYALVLALALALIQSVVPLIGARLRDGAMMAVAEPTALAQFGFVALSFAMLVSCYVGSDFSVRNVFENSHSAMPLIYKFTNPWGNTKARCSVGADTVILRSAGGGFRQQRSAYPRGDGACAGVE